MPLGLDPDAIAGQGQVWLHASVDLELPGSIVDQSNYTVPQRSFLGSSEIFARFGGLFLYTEPQVFGDAQIFGVLSGFYQQLDLKTGNVIKQVDSAGVIVNLGARLLFGSSDDVVRFGTMSQIFYSYEAGAWPELRRALDGTDGGNPQAYFINFSPTGHGFGFAGGGILPIRLDRGTYLTPNFVAELYYSDFISSDESDPLFYSMSTNFGLALDMPWLQIWAEAGYNVLSPFFGLGTWTARAGASFRVF